MTTIEGRKYQMHICVYIHDLECFFMCTGGSNSRLLDQVARFVPSKIAHETKRSFLATVLPELTHSTNKPY